MPVEAPDERTRILVDVTRVNMLFTVTDKKGRFVTDLTKNDFEVIENKKPQVIQEFTAETDLPLRLAILIDTSNSIRDRFKFEQEAAIQFINSVVRPRQDKAHDGRASTPRPNCVADLIDDTTKLAKIVREPASGRRHGALRRHLFRLAATSCSRTSRATNSAARSSS